MNKLFLYTLFISTSILCCWSCGDNLDIFEPREDITPEPSADWTNQNTIDVFANVTAIAERTQQYSINPEVVQRIVTEEQTVITFPANALETLTGEPITGQVDIEVLEIYTKGDMILFGKPTVSAGKLIESAGEFYVSASQAGRELRLRDGATIQFQVQLRTDQPNYDMEVFYGDTDVDGNFTWALGDTSRVFLSEWEINDSLQQWGFGYEFLSENLDWINCDAFVGDESLTLTRLCADLPDKYDTSNSVAFIAFADVNGVLPLHGDAEVEMFCKSNIPVGYEATVVVISKQGEQTDGTPILHLGYQDIVVSEDLVINITPTETSIEDIIAFLSGL